MRQTQSTTSPLVRKPSPPRIREIARFAARINRAIRVEIDSDVVVVTPGENLGMLRYQEIHLEVGRINDLLRHGGYEKLLIDLSERKRIENVILTALVGFCRTIPGRAAFCGVSDEIRQMMEGSNLLGLWPVHDRRAEAVGALRSQDRATEAQSACKAAVQS
ncbi:MAG TPA: hypothetical protein VM452_14535 [Caulifigura sp.]|jgi:anti-anti-sigma regulatory factor|nr:hypothetical protein [Caulifigura sp.]